MIEEVAWTSDMLLGVALTCFFAAGLFVLWLVWVLRAGRVACECPAHVLRSQKNNGVLVVRTKHAPDCPFSEAWK